MSGGIAYVLDEDGTFAQRCNPSMVALEPLLDGSRAGRGRGASELAATARSRSTTSTGHDEAIAARARSSGTCATRAATLALALLDNWDDVRGRKFVKVMPHEYRRALTEMARASRRSASSGRGNATREGARAPDGCHGKDHRLHRARSASRRRRAPVAERVRHYREFVLPLTDDEAREAGRALHGLRHPVLPDRLPGATTSFRTGTTSCTAHQWQRGARRAALDQQLPRVHRPRLPGAVRGGVHAQHQQRSGRHQVDRALHHRQGLGRRLGRAAARRQRKTGKRVAVVGSGPAGLACAQQLARAGHDVVLFEKNDRIGGLLRYGIPDFKMEKHLIDRRIEQMAAEGVTFRPGVARRRRRSGARRCSTSSTPIVLTGGAEAAARPAGARPRARRRPLRDGVPAAAEQGRRRRRGARTRSLATGKHVVVIGGGDTGSDCVGTSNRQGAASVTQFELLPQPPEQENKPLAWPYWPIKLRTSSSHEEGCERDCAVATKRFEGRDGKVEKLIAAHVEWQKDGKGAMKMVGDAGQRVRDPGRPRAARDGLRRPGARGPARAARRASATRAAT